ncbi:MAG: hypothetical protein ACLSVG_07820 [Clostridia bacterium]
MPLCKLVVFKCRFDEQEKEIQKGLDDGIDPPGKKMTVCQFPIVQPFIKSRALP